MEMFPSERKYTVTFRLLLSALKDLCSSCGISNKEQKKDSVSESQRRNYITVRDVILLDITIQLSDLSLLRREVN